MHSAAFLAVLETSRFFKVLPRPPEQLQRTFSSSAIVQRLREWPYHSQDRDLRDAPPLTRSSTIGKILPFCSTCCIYDATKDTQWRGWSLARPTTRSTSPRTLCFSSISHDGLVNCLRARMRHCRSTAARWIPRPRYDAPPCDSGAWSILGGLSDSLFSWKARAQRLLLAHPTTPAKDPPKSWISRPSNDALYDFRIPDNTPIDAFVCPATMQSTPRAPHGSLGTCTFGSIVGSPSTVPLRRILSRGSAILGVPQSSRHAR